MSKEEKPTKENKKKEFIASIHAKLEATFLDFKGKMDEKEFTKALKKGSKLFGQLLFVKSKKEKKNKDKIPVIITKNTDQ